ncbi:DUF4272 domain-containing protein [Cerasicoccus fimbriatus]|uniref:DUF4272 domain-containing protein n=1 Tax=Cerasicoccus fimbriatus TaxID=3014554 RepID=UPI0022B5C8D1|nr:DUF4272 domain-containing protein [Cerasicoccus sp. TK19100]
MIFLVALGVAVCLSADNGPTGPVYVEPLKTASLDEMGGDPTVKNADQPDPQGEALRARSKEILDAAGFRFSSSLPTLNRRAGVPGKLRPANEIQKRLLVSYAVYLYVVYDEKTVSKDDIGALLSVYDLPDEFTRDEALIITKPREQARKEHMDTIGWNLENMEALAWMLGYDEQPALDGKMIGGKRRDALMEFIGESWQGPEAFAKTLSPRSEADVLQLEDTFYCAHNAVRSAQLGHAEQVPEKFHPVRNGGVIHEKREALTWALSPGVEWDATDTST